MGFSFFSTGGKSWSWYAGEFFSEFSGDEIAVISKGWLMLLTWEEQSKSYIHINYVLEYKKHTKNASTPNTIQGVVGRHLLSMWHGTQTSPTPLPVCTCVVPVWVPCTVFIRSGCVLCMLSSLGTSDISVHRLVPRSINLFYYWYF